ncbi:hypothetical protein Hanom_Chr04g00322911 [Helianthus anomalus]
MFSPILGVVVLLTSTYLFIRLLLFLFLSFVVVACLYMFFQKLMSWLWSLEPGVSLEAATLSPGIEVRRAYILPSPDPINRFAIYGIILGMIVVVVVVYMYDMIE